MSTVPFASDRDAPGPAAEMLIRIAKALDERDRKDLIEMLALHLGLKAPRDIRYRDLWAVAELIDRRGGLPPNEAEYQAYRREHATDSPPSATALRKRYGTWMNVISNGARFGKKGSASSTRPVDKGTWRPWDLRGSLLVLRRCARELGLENVQSMTLGEYDQWSAMMVALRRRSGEKVDRVPARTTLLAIADWTELCKRADELGPLDEPLELAKIAPVQVRNLTPERSSRAGRQEREAHAVRDALAAGLTDYRDVLAYVMQAVGHKARGKAIERRVKDHLAREQADLG